MTRRDEWESLFYECMKIKKTEILKQIIKDAEEHSVLQIICLIKKHNFL